MLSGCTTSLKSDKIIAIKQRTFGIHIGASPTTQAPEIKLGLTTTIYQMVPTSTNGPIAAPRYFDTFSIGQGANPFRFDVIENSGFGDVSVTNTQGKAILPAPGMPIAPGGKK